MNITINKTLKLAIICCLFGAFLFTSGCILGFKVFNVIVRGKIAESVVLKENTIQWNRFLELPFPVSFDVYVFNITNHEEVLQGKKPNVVEVGPYVYKQSRKKRIVDVNNDTILYYQYWSHEFDSITSKPLAEDNVITLLNVPFNSLIQISEKESPYSLTAINNAWRQVFNNEASIFHSVTVKEYLFGGYKFCQPKNLNSIGKLVCREIAKRTVTSKSLDTLADGSIQFSLLGYKHNHHDGLYEIMRGLNDVLDIGQIKSWNNITTTNYWSGNNNECDQIFGTDASIYPPYSTPETIFTAYSTDICRKVKLHNTGNMKYEGVKGLRYEQQTDVLDGKDDCFCTKQIRNLHGKVECLPNGFNDMFNCLDAPILLSNPHLLEADTNYRNTVNGLLPNKEQHTTYVELEPDTGTPLRAAKRVQFNMILRPIRNVKITENFTSSVIPIIWIDEHFDLPIELVNELKENYLKKLFFLAIIKWTSIIGGLLIVVGSVAFVFYSILIKKKKLFVRKL